MTSFAVNKFRYIYGGIRGPLCFCFKQTTGSSSHCYSRVVVSLCDYYSCVTKNQQGDDLFLQQQKEDFTPTNWGTHADIYNRTFGHKFREYALEVLQRQSEEHSLLDGNSVFVCRSIVVLHVVGLV